MNVHDLIERIPMPIKSKLPGFAGATDWLNSEPLAPEDLRGKVVLADFWTFTCINWIRTLPYLRAWAETYGPHGLIVLGVHSPEFGIERDVADVRRAAADLGVRYPIAVDNDYAIWNAFGNQYWPALYLADAEGRIRHQHFGEGGYDRAERAIRRLLVEAGTVDLPADNAAVHVRGIEAPADSLHLRSPETYLGLARSVGFGSRGGGPPGVTHVYSAPDQLRTNRWALAGAWTVHAENAVVDERGGRIMYRFHARDVNLILAPPSDGVPVRFRVWLDGQPPYGDHGLDVDDDGRGVVREPRLFQLIRQRETLTDRLVEIEFLDPGAEAFCFTFG